VPGSGLWPAERCRHSIHLIPVHTHCFYRDSSIRSTASSAKTIALLLRLSAVRPARNQQSQHVQAGGTGSFPATCRTASTSTIDRRGGLHCVALPHTAPSVVLSPTPQYTSNRWCRQLINTTSPTSGNRPHRRHPPPSKLRAISPPPWLLQNVSIQFFNLQPKV
jgi:hypothetical protein